MVTESETVERDVKIEEAPRSPYAVLIELEGAAVHARRAEYDALRSLLGEQKVKFPQHVFARCCLNTSPASYLPALLEKIGAKKSATDKLESEVRNGVTMYLSSDEAALNSPVGQLMRVAQQRHMDVALLTGVKESVARALVGKWGRDHERAKVFAFDASSSKVFPRADVWLKIAKSLSRTPSQCIVIAGSSVSVKTALSAGMRCIAVPDEFTAFQDFGGADEVIDSADDIDAAALLDRIAPAKPFI